MASAKTSWGLYQGATSEVSALKAQLAAAERYLLEWRRTHAVLTKAGALSCDGDRVLELSERAESALAQATAERDAAREAHEKAIQTQGKIMDGMRSDLAAARAEIAEALQAFGDWKVEQDSVGRGLRYRIGLTLADLSTARAEVDQAHKILDTYGIARGAFAHSVAYRIGLIDVPAYEARFDAVSAELSSARAEIEAVSKTWRAAEADLTSVRAELERLRVEILDPPLTYGDCPSIEDCPAYYDGCHCTTGCLKHNIDRAEKAEAALAEAEVEVGRMRIRVAHWENEEVKKASCCVEMEERLSDALAKLKANGLED